jgi:signal transduction histidine kinase
MEPAGATPQDTRRLPVDWPSFLLDAGYFLLIAGGTLLFISFFPAAHPLLPTGFLICFALILLPVRRRLLRQKPVGRGSAPMETDFPTAEESPGQLRASSSPESGRQLLELSETLNSASDFDVLLELLAAQILRRMPAESLRIALPAGQANAWSYVLYLENNVRRADREGVWIPPAGELVGEILRTGQAIVTADYSEACRMRTLPEREPAAAWAGFPLSAGVALIGALILTRPAPFRVEELTELESIAAVAGPALAKARLEREARRRSALLADLVRVSRGLIGSSGGERIPALLLAGARDLFPCQTCFLLLPDAAGGWLLNGTPAGQDRVTGISTLPSHHPLAKSGPGDRPVFMNRLAEDDPLRAAVRGGAADFVCAVSLPLRRREKIFGWIVFWNPRSGLPPAESEEMVLNEFAAVAVAALEPGGPRTAADPAAAALSEELTSLSQLDQDLNGADNPAQATAVMLDWALRYADASAGLAGIRSGDVYEIAAARGYPDGSGPRENDALPLELEGFSEAVRSGKAVRRVATGDSPAGLLPGGRTALFLPILRNAQILGWMLLESPAADAFAKPQAEILERLCAHAAIAISNAQLYAEVRGANQAKSEFISFVAHELKTPMTSIRGYTDLVAQGAVGPVSQPQANFLATIRLNVDRMAALVSDLNDISRIESGRLRLEFAAIPVGPALEEVLEALRSQIEGKEQKLALEIPDGLPPAWVDRGRLIQILTNLVSNAHKYTPAGGSLRIAAENAPNRWDPAGPPEVIHFLIQDSGLGISAQEQNSIFQKFFRSEDGTVRDLPGTGLGLHITRNLVEMHGGRIWFESEFRRGSTFHFTVPAASL